MIATPPDAKLRLTKFQRVRHRRRPRAGLPDREDFQPRRPARAVLLRLLAVPLPIVLWAAGVLGPAGALVFVGLVIVLALIRGCFEAVERARDSRVGELLLRTNPRRPPVSAIAAWRSAELTAAGRRHRLRRSVRQLRRETEACIWSRHPAADEAAIDESLVLLARLENRLDLSPEPVEPLGMLEARALTLEALDDLSPLYYPGRAHDLRTKLAQALVALEPE
jgi:hypothetical protein